MKHLSCYTRFHFYILQSRREEIEKKSGAYGNMTFVSLVVVCKSCNVIISKSCKRRMKGNHFARLFLCCCVRKQKLIFVQGFLLTCNHANQNHPIFVILAAKKCVKRHCAIWHGTTASGPCVPPPPPSAGVAPLHVWHKALELLHIWLGSRRKNAFLRHVSILKPQLLCITPRTLVPWKRHSEYLKSDLMLFFVRAWSL